MSPIETELEREMRLAEEFDAAQEANRAQVLEDFIATQDRARDEAVAGARAREGTASGKGKATREDESELSAERYSREMRSNGTAAQQAQWRGFPHEVRG
jgi:hypothetical protein